MPNQPLSPAQQPQSPVKEPPFSAEELSLRAQEDRYVGEAQTKEERLFRAKAVAQARKTRAAKAKVELTTPPSSGKQAGEQNQANN